MSLQLESKLSFSISRQLMISLEYDAMMSNIHAERAHGGRKFNTRSVENDTFIWQLIKFLRSAFSCTACAFADSWVRFLQALC